MDRRKLSAIIFIAGLVPIIATLALAFSRQVNADTIWMTRTLISASGLAVIALVALGLTGKGRARWWALFLASVLLLAISVPTMFSIGLITLPVSIVLLVVSLWRLEGQKGAAKT